MNNIINFSNRQLCEFHSIFPSVAILLDHMLFVMGNGYYFDPESGMLGYKEKLINEYPLLTDNDWENLIEQCKEKEKEYAKRYNYPISLLKKNLKRYHRMNVTPEDFSEDSLFKQIEEMDKSLKEHPYSDGYYRPYPLTRKLSQIYNLNKNTPLWFYQIVLNFCRACKRFLDQRIAVGDVKEMDEKLRDYADLGWTIRTRDQIAEVILDIEGKINVLSTN